MRPDGGMGDGIGVDARLDRRPGVPMEKRPEELPRGELASPMDPAIPVTRLHAKKRMPPVFGTAQLPRGLSGLLRRAVYRIPEHRPEHWLGLIFADRVDIVESFLGREVRKPRSWIALGAGALLLVRAMRRRR